MRNLKSALLSALGPKPMTFRTILRKVSYDPNLLAVLQQLTAEGKVEMKTRDGRHAFRIPSNKEKSK